MFGYQTQFLFWKWKADKKCHMFGYQTFWEQKKIGLIFHFMFVRPKNRLCLCSFFFGHQTFIVQSAHAKQDLGMHRYSHQISWSMVLIRSDHDLAYSHTLCRNGILNATNLTKPLTIRNIYPLGPRQGELTLTLTTNLNINHVALCRP
jgi:hypothetical protein